MDVLVFTVAIGNAFLPFLLVGDAMAAARDIMSETFHTLLPETPVSEAISLFRKASVSAQRQIFGIMVLDHDQRLVGILSMYDILLYVQPRHIHIWGEMKDLDVSGLVEKACSRCANILVGDLMVTEVITVSPDDHIFMVLEIMNKRHIRRLPVVKEERVVGIVYISDLFYHLLDKIPGSNLSSALS